jgi:hypothetical protein
MDPELAKKMIAALESGDAAAALEIVKEALASAASGGAPPADSAGGEALADAPDPEVDADEPVAAAQLAQLAKATGHKSVGALVAALSGGLAEIEKFRGEQAATELIARRELVADLVKLGVELPATAWEGKAEDRKPVARLMAEPIADLRTRVAMLSKGVKPRNPEPPPSGKGDPSTLSASELAACKKAGITPEEYIQRKASYRRNGKQ